MPGMSSMAASVRSMFDRDRKPRAVNIQRECYTMAMTDGLDAEIRLYGEIVRTRPVDWWTGEPIAGDFIMLDEFLADLNTIAGAKTILIRIDSIGGDSEVSIVIHNRLRELPAKKTARIDGVAMSGGALITCAASTVQVNPASQFMIHKCWTYVWGIYNADELRETADQLDPTDKSQVAILKEKTGKTEEELLSMLSKTTTLVGQEIIDSGFADELLEAAGEKLEIAASADGRSLFINGRTLRMAPFAVLPEGIKVVDPAQADSTNNDKPTETGGKEGEQPIMAKTLEELRKEDPDLATALMADAQAAMSEEIDKKVSDALEGERKRIKEIDEVSTLFDDEIVREAKYGEKPCTAQEMTYRAVQEAAKTGKAFMSKVEADNSASGAQDVPGTPGEDGNNGNPENIEAEAKRVAKMYNEMIGGKKDE